MKLEEILSLRSENKCELCGSAENVMMYDVKPRNNASAENTLMACAKCEAQIEKKEEMDSNHWKKLSESMWSEVPGIQVVAWRMLNRLKSESWAADSLDLLYLDDDNLEWAKASGDHLNDGPAELHKDAYGHVLQTGDTVLLTQSLNVKGSSANAKIGTLVKNIRLVPDNTDQIEGRIEGQLIVILTKYVRKQVS